MFYFIMENGDGAYVEATSQNDPLWNPATCIEVPQRPTPGYTWNNISKEWEVTIESQQNYIRPIRNDELARCDKYVLPDYPLTAEQVTGALTYRQQLREVPDKATPQEMVMPNRPSYLDPKP